MKRIATIAGLITGLLAHASAGPFVGAVGTDGSTALAANDPKFVAWATGYADLVRGPRNMAIAGSPPASFGAGESALGAANAVDPDGFPSTNGGTVVSLGDGGRITLRFAAPITDLPGADFAVFENGFNDTFLELAFVEVSSDGVGFARFPSISLTPTTRQIDQADDEADGVDPTDIDGLAGKYRAGFGTPFDLEILRGMIGLDVDRVTHVRIIDVVGSINPLFASFDADPVGVHVINEPWPTPFASGGFDLDAVGVLHQVPEPQAAAFLAAACACLLVRRPRANSLR